MTADDDRPPVRYEVETMFGARTRKPLVVVKAPDAVTMMAPDDARRLGMNLIRAAEAATSDALMIRFMDERIGAPPEAAAAILVDWRKWREELEGDEV